MRSMRAMVSRVSVADIPAVGSSRRSRSGSLASAIPSSSCFWLPCDMNAHLVRLSRRPMDASTPWRLVAEEALDAGVEG